MWIARDKNGHLFTFNKCPKKQSDGGFKVNSDSEYIEIDNRKFPEITWKNSPLEIKSTIIPRGIDLEQRRYEIARSAMIGLISRGNDVNTEFSGRDSSKTLIELIAERSVKYADALIKELKK